MSDEATEERAFRALVAYDGLNFSGWQYQPNARTVQGELERALHAVTAQSVRIQGAGRTDQGVHAHGQVASFRTGTSLSPSDLQKGLNSLLPKDIVITAAEEADLDFHAQLSAMEFYKRHGYEPHGAVFEEAGMPHVEMKKRL